MSESDPLLLEQRVQRGEDLYVRRVTTRGEVWARSHLPRYTGGLEPTEAGHSEWELLATLPQTALHALREEIAQSGVLDIAPEPVPPGTVVRGTTESLTAELDGRRNQVTIHGRSATELPEVRRVEDALEAALAAADE